MVFLKVFCFGFGFYNYCYWGLSQSEPEDPIIHYYSDVDTFVTKFAKKVNLASLKSNVDKLDFDKVKDLPTNLSNLESEVDKLDADKLVPVPVDLSKLTDVVKTNHLLLLT